jgi:hypothetical protein
VHKSEKKEVCGQPAVEARARARDGSRSSSSRWGALAEQGGAGSGFGRRPLPCQCGPGAIAPVGKLKFKTVKFSCFFSLSSLVSAGKY